MKYINKNIVIDAIQFTGENLCQVIDFCRKHIDDRDSFKGIGSIRERGLGTVHDSGVYTIEKHKGDVITFLDGYYILKEESEIWVTTMKPHEFERKYKQCK